jgi:hypothetical protein
MQQAFVQPFIGEVEISQKDQAKRKMVSLLGNKKKMLLIQK